MKTDFYFIEKTFLILNIFKLLNFNLPLIFSQPDIAEFLGDADLR